MKAWIVDAGPLVALFDRSDSAHEWTKKTWARAPMPLLTCEAVLAEAAYLLSEHAEMPPARLLALLERKVVAATFDLESNIGPVMRLLEKYADQKMQLADACIVRMSELKRDCQLFTLDKTDFSIYRRFDRQGIPLISPD